MYVGVRPEDGSPATRPERPICVGALLIRWHEAKSYSGTFGPVGGYYDVSAALEVMQIDHTCVDAIVVSEGTRKPLGRPWITLAIDVASRIVMGMFISFDASSITLRRSLR
jgi:hypothetical protein